MRHLPRLSYALVAMLALLLAGCAVGGGLGGGGDRASRAPAPQPQNEQQAELPKTGQLDATQARRLQDIMKPLIQHMNRPIPFEQVKIGLLDDPGINAANAGGGEFYVTTGLLQKASDEQLRGVMAHEVAHADLGHVAKQQALHTGLSLGIGLLDEFFPGSGAFTPIAGQLLANGYSRGEETEADAHGVAILKRAGYDGKAVMANTLTWIQQTSGGSGGGFFATHPATGDRIQAVQRLP